MRTTVSEAPRGYMHRLEVFIDWLMQQGQDDYNKDRSNKKSELALTVLMQYVFQQTIEFADHNDLVLLFLLQAQ